MDLTMVGSPIRRRRATGSPAGSRPVTKQAKVSEDLCISSLWNDETFHEALDGLTSNEDQLWVLKRRRKSTSARRHRHHPIRGRHLLENDPLNQILVQ
jgi:hypothetical protein